MSQPIPPPNTPRSIEVKDLMNGHQEIALIHNGQTYRLRITRFDKLILTK